jgi:hypothetical protein
MQHEHANTHLAGTWILVWLENKVPSEPFEFFWKDDSVSFSYGNGHVCDYTIENGNYIKWGNHL